MVAADPRVLASLRLLARHGGVVEARLLHTKRGTISGYFNDLEALAAALAPWDGHTNIYISANPVHPDLLARASNRLREYARETTSDADVMRRVWFLTDFDPVRPSGISATDVEMHAACARRDEAVAFLSEMEFPDPVLAMSGNGGHALWPVDLPNDATSTDLVKRAIEAVHARFTDNVVSVDRSVFNASRIWKVYGTRACTGDATAARPHRRSALERVPSELGLVDLERLQALAQLAPPPARTVSTPRGPGDLPPLDLVGAFTARGWYKRPLSDGKHGVVCPWASEHSGDSGPTESCLFEPKMTGEPWGFDCKHAHCVGRSIREVIAVLGLSPNGCPDAEPMTEAPAAEVPYAFTPAVPAGHFLADYIHYASERTDAAHEYHEAVGLLLLAAATAGLKIRLRQFTQGLATNLFVLILGDSTRSRKSTSKDLGRDIFDAVVPDGSLADTSSPEGFAEQLAQRPAQSSVWWCDEFGGLLHKLHHTKYMAGLQEALLELYDGRDYRANRHSKRTSKGEKVEDADEIRDPHLCLLGLATPALFDRLLPPDLDSGLLVRFAIIAPPAKPPRRGFSEAPADLEAQREALRHRLHQLVLWNRSTRRRVTVVPAALHALDQFAAQMEQDADELDAGQRLMVSRLDAMVIKLAMLVSAGRPETLDADSLSVTELDAAAARAIATRWHRDAIAFAARIGESALERRVSRAQSLLARARGAVPRRRVARMLHCSKRDLDEVESTLQDRGLIRVDRKEARGRPTLTTWVPVKESPHA